LTSKWLFFYGNVIFQCKWLVFASIKQWPWPKLHFSNESRKRKTNFSWPLTLIMQKRDHFRLLRHHYSESPVIPLSNDIWYRCVAHGFITFDFLIFYRWSISPLVSSNMSYCDFVYTIRDVEWLMTCDFVYTIRDVEWLMTCDCVYTIRDVEWLISLCCLCIMNYNVLEGLFSLTIQHLWVNDMWLCIHDQRCWMVDDMWLCIHDQRCWMVDDMWLCIHISDRVYTITCHQPFNISDRVNKITCH
jgi:hypothetical protein